MSKQRHLIIIWTEGGLRGSHMCTFTRWRPFITYLSVREAVDTHEAQYGGACITDVIDVTDPNNIRSVFDENA